MSQPPDLMPLNDYGGNWAVYEDAIYAEYLATVAHAGLRFLGEQVKVRFHPETKKKGYGFWHLISEAPSKKNRNENDRIPDLNRCARIRWVAWCIQNVDSIGFCYWENQRGSETHVVIWAEIHDFAVVLAKRQTEDGLRYYLLKTAYCLQPHRRKSFIMERDTYRASRKD